MTKLPLPSVYHRILGVARLQLLVFLRNFSITSFLQDGFAARIGFAVMALPRRKLLLWIGLPWFGLALFSLF